MFPHVAKWEHKISISNDSRWLFLACKAYRERKKPSRTDGWTFSFVCADADVSLNASHPHGANPASIYIQIRSRAAKIEKKIETDRGAASIADWNINCPKVNFMHHNDFELRTNTQRSAGPHPKPQGFSLLWHAYVEGTTRPREKEKRTFFSNYQDGIRNPTWQMAPGLLFHVDTKKTKSRSLRGSPFPSQVAAGFIERSIINI